MTGNKKVSCKVCYREMRSDHLTRHMKQHSKRNESNPVTNISVTKNYNTTSSVLADREDEVECEPHTTIDEQVRGTTRCVKSQLVFKLVARTLTVLE